MILHLILISIVGFALGAIGRRVVGGVVGDITGWAPPFAEWLAGGAVGAGIALMAG